MIDWRRGLAAIASVGLNLHRVHSRNIRKYSYDYDLIIVKRKSEKCETSLHMSANVWMMFH